MGMADWFKSQQQKMDHAYRNAAEFHARFGANALAFCRDELTTAQDDEQRRTLRQVENTQEDAQGARRLAQDLTPSCIRGA